MSLIFEQDVAFDPVTHDAVIWADGLDGERFQLVILRTTLMDRYGLTGLFHHDEAAQLISEHRLEWERAAEDAYQAGKLELEV